MSPVTWAIVWRLSNQLAVFLDAYQPRIVISSGVSVLHEIYAQNGCDLKCCNKGCPSSWLASVGQANNLPCSDRKRCQAQVLTQNATQMYTRIYMGGTYPTQIIKLAGVLKENRVLSKADKTTSVAEVVAEAVNVESLRNC